MVFAYVVLAGAIIAIVSFVVGNFIKGFMQAVHPVRSTAISSPQLRIFNPED